MNKYRDLYLKDINKDLIGKTITVSGWVNRSRDHGNLLFIDLRDSTSLPVSYTHLTLPTTPYV